MNATSRLVSKVQSKIRCWVIMNSWWHQPEDKARARSKDRRGGIQAKVFCRGQSALGMALGEKGLSVLCIPAKDFEVDIGKSDPSRVALSQTQVCAMFE